MYFSLIVLSWESITILIEQHINIEFSRLAYELRAFTYNRLKSVGKYEHPTNPPPTYKNFYSLGFKTFKVAMYTYSLLPT
jgi:hypothetical protein